jgi:hypothetical protein
MTFFTKMMKILRKWLYLFYIPLVRFYLYMPVNLFSSDICGLRYNSNSDSLLPNTNYTAYNHSSGTTYTNMWQKYSVTGLIRTLFYKFPEVDKFIAITSNHATLNTTAD